MDEQALLGVVVLALVVGVPCAVLLSALGDKRRPRR
jgi:hypothetical protein